MLISCVHKTWYNWAMDDIAMIRWIELAQLDLLEAMLRDRLAQADLPAEKRAINLQLHRVNRLRAMWRLWQPKGGNLDAVHERKGHQ